MTTPPTGPLGDQPDPSDAEPMTAGRAALIEAARLETARVYGQLCREHRSHVEAQEPVAKVLRFARKGAA